MNGNQLHDDISHSNILVCQCCQISKVYTHLFPSLCIGNTLTGNMRAQSIPLNVTILSPEEGNEIVRKKERGEKFWATLDVYWEE